MDILEVENSDKDMNYPPHLRGKLYVDTLGINHKNLAFERRCLLFILWL